MRWDLVRHMGAFHANLANFLPAPEISLLILLKALSVASTINLFKYAHAKRKCLERGTLVGKSKVRKSS